MKIGVVSDTHFNDLAEGLSFFEELCLSVFSEVELILHAGDIIHPDLLDCFDTKPILGVRGNCDEYAPDLPEARTLELGRVNIGLIHGWGAPGVIINNILSRFDRDKLSVLIFGHSHYPYCRHDGDLLLFNPGSATDRRNAPYHSVGILDVGDTVEGKIINIDSDIGYLGGIDGATL